MLPAIEFPEIEVLTFLRIVNNGILSQISFPALTTISDGLEIISSGTLTPPLTVDFSGMGCQQRKLTKAFLKSKLQNLHSELMI